MQWNLENLLGNNGNTINCISFDRLTYDRLRNLWRLRAAYYHTSVVCEIPGFEAFRDGLGIEKLIYTHRNRWKTRETVHVLKRANQNPN